MTTNQLVTGIVPPLCTPLTADGAVDVASLARSASRQLDAGVDGLFVLGSSGEVAFLTDQERDLVIDTVVRTAAGQVPVLAGAIDMTTNRVRGHIDRAAALGADGAVVTAPFYTRTHPVEIDRHFRLLAASSSIPLVAYDIPVSVGTKLDADLLIGLGRDKVIAGVKDSSGNDAAMRGLVLDAKEIPESGFSILTGSEITVDSAYAFGVDGCVPGLGNVDPHGYVRLAKAAKAGDWATAKAEQERLIALFGLVNAGGTDRMGRASSALGAFKVGMHLLGAIDSARTSDPYIQLNEDEIDFVRTHLVNAGLL